MPADKGGPEERLFTPPPGFGSRGAEFSPDGRLVVLMLWNTGAARGELWQLPLTTPRGAQRATPLLPSWFNVTSPAFSPDGRWLAFVSDETGRNEVYVRPYPGPGGRVLVPSGGGRMPTWAPDGAAALLPAVEHGRSRVRGLARGVAHRDGHADAYGDRAGRDPPVTIGPVGETGRAQL